MQAARGQIEKAANIKLQLTSPSSAPTLNQPIFSPSQSITNLPVPPPSNPLTSFVNSIDKEESQKLTAAAVAAKLTASSSSALMFTSVLSSFVAEEAASKSSGLKRPKLDSPVSFSGVTNPEGNNSAYFPSTQQASTNMPSVQSLGGLSLTQLNPLQAPFLPPPPAPPPLAPPANVSGNPLMQSPMMGLPYNFGASNMLPAPLSSNATTAYARPGPPPQQAHPQLQNQQGQSQQQQPANGGYFRPPAVGFYAHSHQPTTPPIHKQ
ncbi:regulation of nuclear pre-mRNA domain-containing protein 1B-like [Dorcoceras hygrometricum]|uniref:Regulation of nuclear pre-mRNA domain-containing protein 1B-like n=1 Tax=Dorcoceras hygrometricum TaxID=472368 RepID=A0A2Z7BPS8_9LAMI|nr:regulation of nuclear pre-mRNA domain-containing protein 1B-like [Dorcoceras hygrometricum]